jgi:hypothetical protein
MMAVGTETVRLVADGIMRLEETLDEKKTRLVLGGGVFLPKREKFF